MTRRNPEDKEYFYVDIQVPTRQIIGWGIEKRADVETQLSGDYYRIFLSRGQYNKLVKRIEQG